MSERQAAKKFESCQRDTRFLICILCKKRARSKVNLIIHYNNVHRVKPDVITKLITYNNRRLNRKVKVNQPANNVNGPLDLFLCIVCNVATDSYDKFVEHSQKHVVFKDYQPNKIACSHCHYAFEETCYNEHVQQTCRGTYNDILKYDQTAFLTIEWFGIFKSVSNERFSRIMTKSIYIHVTNIKLKKASDEDVQSPFKNIYKCETCGMYVDPISVSNHAYNYKLCGCPELKTRPCAHCNISYNSLRSLLLHEEDHKKYSNYRTVLFNHRDDWDLNNALEKAFCIIHRRLQQTRPRIEQENSVCKENVKTKIVPQQLCNICNEYISYPDFKNHYDQHLKLRNQFEAVMEKEVRDSGMTNVDASAAKNLSNISRNEVVEMDINQSGSVDKVDTGLMMLETGVVSSEDSMKNHKTLTGTEIEKEANVCVKKNYSMKSVDNTTDEIVKISERDSLNLVEDTICPKEKNFREEFQAVDQDNKSIDDNVCREIVRYKDDAATLEKKKKDEFLRLNDTIAKLFGAKD